MAAAGVMVFLLKIPLGCLVDKFHPLRIYNFGMILVVLTNLVSIVVFRNPAATCDVLNRLLPASLALGDENAGYVLFFAVTMLLSLVYAIQFVAELPMFVALLPHDRYGQFCSAHAMFRAVMVMICGWGGGKFIEWTGNNYLYMYVWDAGFTILSLASMLWLFRLWKKLGGDQAYVAP